jgi:hypothetical protein
MDINAQDEFGATALFKAVSEEDLKEVRRLLSRGADPNIPEVNGITALMEAASTGNIELIHLLLANGADLYRLDNFGDSAIEYARSQGFVEAANVLTALSDTARIQALKLARELKIAKQRRHVADIVARLDETRLIDVWYLVRGGEVLGMAQTKDQAERLLPPNDVSSASLEMKQELVGVVEGILRHWGDDDDPRPHVSWNCPACGETHHTDLLDADEPNPGLWYCENGFGGAKFLVRWASKQVC